MKDTNKTTINNHQKTRQQDNKQTHEQINKQIRKNRRNKQQHTPTQLNDGKQNKQTKHNIF